jgi:hypothetical protein
MLSGDIHKVLAARFYRVTQLEPASVRDPAAIDLLVNRPDLRVDGLRSLDDVMVSNENYHREGFVPCLPVHQGRHTRSVRSSRTGDKSTAITRNDVNIFIGTGNAAHRFYVESAGAEYDVLQIAEAAVAEWTKFLSGQGLL